MKSLNGKVIALTGASSGIGRSLAINLAQQGAHLALADVNEAGLKETTSMIGTHTKITNHIVNVAERDQMHQWADDVIKEHGVVDAIINNAGVTSMHSIEDISYEDFEWVFNIDFYGVLYGVKAFLPYLKQRPESHIVNISSVNGFVPFPNNGPYNCAKHAVKALSQTLIQELHGTPVNVTSVHPGGIKTNIVRSGRFKKGAAGNTHEEMTKNFDNIAQTSPDQAAKIIISGMLRNKHRQLVGKDAVVIELLSRLMPNRFSSWLGKRTQQDI